MLSDKIKAAVNKAIDLLNLRQKVWSYVVDRSVKEKSLSGLYEQLGSIVPDISGQYTNFYVENELSFIVRASHAFQMAVLKEAVDRHMKEGPACRNVLVGDIGDSAGTHHLYLKKMYPSGTIEALSINMDPKAIEKICKNGLNAVCCRAEQLDYSKYPIDIFCSFQMLEHLEDPIGFMKKLGAHAAGKYFVITVPLVESSRMGLEHIRMNKQGKFPSEITHIFELCPADWDLLFMHSGWEIVQGFKRSIYPSSFIGRFFEWLLRGKNDAVGNYCVILKQNSKWKDAYGE